jgi:hypothetical protein
MRIPLGSRGSLRGLPVEVIGFLERSVTVEGTRYPWGEDLLRVAKGGGYRWLSEANGHWVFLEPVSLGEVEERPGRGLRFRGANFRHFQGGQAVVDAVFGEAYWEVKVGETVRSEDYVAPPRLVSVETSGTERHATLGSHCEPAEIAAAFGLKGPRRTPSGVGPCQPNPHRANLGRWWLLCGGFAAADLAFTAAGAATDRETWVFPCCLTLPLLLFPALIVSTRSSSFETARWSESDHPRGE